MFISVLGFGFQGQPKDDNTYESMIYNGYEFIPQNGIWNLQIGNFQFGFKYNPNEVSKIDSEVNDLSSYANKPLYIKSENPESEFELYRNLDNIILRRQYACLNKEGCEGDYPIKTCEDNFIIIEQGNSSEILQEENCVFIRGPSENLTYLTDEFLFKIIGIE